MSTPLQHWLSFRVRLLVGGVLIVSTLLPAYVPSSALSGEENPFQPPQFLFVEEGFLMKTSSLGEQGARLAYSEGLVHTVKDGDSIEKIAQQYNISPQTIIWANGLDPAKSIRAGTELVILPVDGVLHTVRHGQTLSRIAEVYGVPVEAISRQNKLKNAFITAGQQLIIPGAKPVGTSTIAKQTGPLRFTDKLTERNIQLPVPEGTKVPAQAATVVPTAGIFQMPCNNCYITQYFHPGHYAIDIQTKGGGPIFAAEDGVVTRADKGWDGGYGNVIEIDHGNGIVSLYGHNRDLYVKVGDNVKRGQQIAFMGHTGLVYGATGIHVHFEVRVDGVKKNPLLYLE